MTRSISRAVAALTIGLAMVFFQATVSVAVVSCVNNAECICNQYSDDAHPPTNPTVGHDPLNVVLIVLDDASQSDLPFLNPPVVWNGSDTDPQFPTKLGEAGLLQPDMNRLAARSFAISAGTSKGYLGHVNADNSGPIVVPRDLPTSEYPGAIAPNTVRSTRFRYDENSTDPAHHVITGFGGFGALARNGVVIGRHYTTSSVCSPTRASILTGRYPSEVGVPENNHDLDMNQLTIADFLKQVGPIDSQGNVRYHTGIVGKWDLGSEAGKTASERGFDESFMYRRHYRNDFTSAALDCAQPAGAAQGWGAYIGPDPNITACSPSTLRTDPLCCTAPDSRGVDGRYNFKEKRNANEQPYWDDDSSGSCATYEDSLPAADDVAPDFVACRFGTRFYSDVASNFIRRNAQRPFFLYVATHAPHTKLDAPKKVKDHYLTNPSGSDLGKPRWPGGRTAPEKFWPVLEELDAAVGRIIQTIKDEQLESKTLVLLTSDNAHEGSPTSPSYGAPALRGAKTSLEEGGVRMGLATWNGGSFGSRSSADLAAISNAVTSHVDIFPTIVHAAGCKPNTDGQYRFGTCEGGYPAVPKFCRNNSECASGVCVTRRIEGRTLLPLISTRVRDYNEGPSNSALAARKFVFAEFPKKDPAIIAKTNLSDPSINFRVCRKYETAVADTNIEISRDRRAGSTITCSSSSECTNANAKCEAAGKFCVPDTDKSACETGSTGCNWTTYRRCHNDGDCSSTVNSTVKCSTLPVKVPCLDCAPAATWKLRGNSQAGTWSATHLFDLSTNPEEKISLDFVTHSSTNSDSVKSLLLQRLRGWYDCETNKRGDDATATTDCESRPVVP